MALQPMTVAVDASSKAFQFYKSGIIDEDSDCGTKLNHALVIVGYTEKGAKPPAPEAEPEPEKKEEASPEAETEQKPPVPEPAAEPEAAPSSDPDPVKTCTVTKWWRNCTYDSEDDRRRLQDTQGEDDYWKGQNSWGTDWGDAGFVKIAIRKGRGVCGMNSYIQYVDWEDSMYK